MSLKEKIKKARERHLEKLEAEDEEVRTERETGKKAKGRIGRRIIVIIVSLAIVSGAVYGAYRFVFHKTSSTQSGNNQGFGGNQAKQNVITASGTSTLGMVEENFDVNNLDTDLEVEKVYVSNGDTVKKGDKILKISDDSLEEARTELEQAEKEAKYAYQLGEISTKQELITAKSTYDSAAINSEYAQNDYDSSIQDAKEKVSDLEDQVSDAEDLVEEYTKAETENYYYTYYDVENLKNIAYENFQLLMKLYDEWNIADTESDSSTTSASGSSSGTVSTYSGTDSTTSSSSSGSTTSTSSGSTSGTTSSSSSTLKISNSLSSLYDAFSDKVDEEEQEYEDAQENYEDKTKTAKASLNKAKANLTSLKAQLTEAKTAYNTAVAEAKSTYNETIAAGKTAKETYQTSVDKVDDELQTLQDAMDDADDNLEAFEDAVSDGYMYASTDGTIMMVGVEEGDTLSSDSMVVAYTDATSVSVSASVDQSSISQITLGEAAQVTFDDYGTFEGKVVAINPETQSSSRSSVTYTVTILLSGDVSSLSQNLSATVVFEGTQAEDSSAGDSSGTADSSGTEDSASAAGSSAVAAAAGSSMESSEDEE